MERIFGWEVVGVVVPFLLAIGIGVLAIDNYLLAKLCFALAGAVTAFKLGLVAALTPNVDLPPTVGLLVLAYACIGATVYWGFRRADALEVAHSTRLKPGRRPTPPLPTGLTIPDTALIVFLGSNVAWATKMPHTILEITGQKMLAIDRRGRELVVSILRLFDDRGHILARIDEQGFWVDSSVRKERPDASTLAVFDRKDAEVLRVSFLNRRALAITGVLRGANGAVAVVITPDMLQMGGLTMRSSSMGEANTDIVLQ